MDKACQVSCWYSTQQCFLKIWFLCTFSYYPRDVGFLTGGICFCETAIAPMGFMACSRRLDQTGMYLKNEYSVFKGHPDFRPYKVSLTRILRFRVGLVGALWLSLQDHLLFVLIFSVLRAAWLGQKNTPLVSQQGIKDYNVLIWKLLFSTKLNASGVFVIHKRV